MRVVFGQVLIDMAADRGAFVDQSQSLNLFVAGAPVKKPGRRGAGCDAVPVCVVQSRQRPS